MPPAGRHRSPARQGRPPFRAASALDTVLQVINDDPVPPRTLNPKVPRDLETIALKCLQKDPTRRYATSSDLADDLDRFRRDEPIRARPASALERLLKRARRHPGATATLALAVFATVFFFANQSVQNARRRARTELAQQRLEQAVAAVEKVMARAGSPAWARRPELQADRREMIEEAQEALAAAERAVALAPDDEDAQSRLADAHQALGYYYSFSAPQQFNRHHEQAKATAGRTRPPT